MSEWKPIPSGIKGLSDGRFTFWNAPFHFEPKSLKEDTMKYSNYLMIIPVLLIFLYIGSVMNRTPAKPASEKSEYKKEEESHSLLIGPPQTLV